MGSSYDTAPWGNLFVAEVGASAALVGLLFVAVSINLAKIIEVKGLSGRAFEALTLLVMVLFVGTFALVPGQSVATLGVEVLLVGLAASALTIYTQRHAPKHPGAPRSWMVMRVAATQTAALPMIAAGVSLIVGHGGGLYLTVAGVIGAFLAALMNAWVLLIEIQR